ncbi:GPW/gp25 family protein [Bradyrhizobium diazoefficiens]|uniref:GPW/gp25 family protein n=1 Tax=Bradyrhizobium diazoefficiens TaxID=1355477 RepID=UPI002729D166|nr:GPW/gp25 family protein [Bradyrhizobium diazoefficiens]WLA69199.1 GPW/gp25 family protein [Bradyrhizobium diazoefficiens]
MDQNAAGKEFLGVGWSFPFTVLPDGAVQSVSYEKDIEQAIYIILATAKGERVMRPDFGCGIHDLVFSAIDTALIGQIKRDVTDALRTFEARIEVLRVAVGQGRVLDGRLDIEIDYRVRTTNQPGNYVYSFYFKEAA